MDLRERSDETASAMILPSNVARPSRLTRWGLLGILVTLGGCDKIKSALDSSSANAADPAWIADSTLVASNPTTLMRVVRQGSDTRVIPIATTYPSAFRALTMSDRGWRLLDLRLLHRSATVVPLADGRALSPIAIRRGMWEGAPLDTVEGCAVLPPAASVAVPAGAQLVVAGALPSFPKARPLTGSARDDALASALMLMAPAAGLPTSALRRYRQRVDIVPTGASPTETMIVTFDDPVSLPDTVTPYGQRPRQLIVVLDKGIYGYKPTYIFKTLGNAADRARRRFLGALDTDGDGVAELFFGVDDPKWPLVTYALTWETDVWRERFKYERARCHR